MSGLKKVLVLFLLSIPFVLSAENQETEKPVLGRLVERNGFLYDTFYYHMNGEPQYLLQKYDEIAIPHSENLKSLQNLRFNGIRFSDFVKEVSFDAQNFRAFRIINGESDRRNWLKMRNVLAKNGVAAWPVLTYHAKNSPVVLDGTMDLVFPKTINKEEQEKILEAYGLKVVEIVDEENSFYTVSLPAGTDPFAIANSLFERQLVKWAQPNWLWHFKPMSTTPNDTYFKKQWHLTQINAPEAWDHETAANKDVRIAIVDSGVDLTHPDLNVLTDLGKDYIGDLGGAPNTEGNPNDREGVPHGTACAGLAAAKTNNGQGVSASCWGCPVIPIRLIPDDYDDPEQQLYSNTMYKALKYAVDNGAWVISNSWGSGDENTCYAPADNSSSEGVEYGIKNGRNGKGSVFLWAAGNEYCDTKNYEFLKDNNFLTVSALNSNGNKENYSNYGKEIDISAGAGAYTTDIQGTRFGYSSLSGSNGDYTGSFSGTSAATPVAAGAVALMLAANPDMTVSGAMNCVKISARRPSNSCSQGSWTTQSDEWIESGSREHSPCFGFGIVDAEAMVINAKNGTCKACIPTSAIDGCKENYKGRDDDCDGIIDNDCENGGIGRAGDACSSAADCINTAKSPKCITGSGWTDGYCSADCTKNSDCYNGGGSRVECYEGQCIAKCAYNEVRSGYECAENKILPEGTIQVVISCGDDRVDGGEACDGNSRACIAIDSSFTGGTAFCNEDCTGFDTSTCAGGSDEPDNDGDTASVPDEDNDSGENDVTDSGSGESENTDPADSGSGGTENTDSGDSGGNNDSGNGFQPGELGGECYRDNTCDEGLVCNGYICIEKKPKKTSGGCSISLI